jgi:hypothetical protein
MKLLNQTAILLSAFLLFGTARLPFEKKFHEELTTQNYLYKNLATTTKTRIGQTSAAIALGGLRTLVASFLNFKAFNYFMNHHWDDLNSTYQTIVDLAPNTIYYWESASWHLAYNAASHYRYDSTLKTIIRKIEWKKSILNGKKYLTQGIENNPDHWRLHAALGTLLSNPNLYPAFPENTFPESANAFRRAAQSPDAPDFIKRALFYSLARSPRCEHEALSLGLELYSNPQHQTPTFFATLTALQAFASPQDDPLKIAMTHFKSPENAYNQLSKYWNKSNEGYPIYGISHILESLENQLHIPKSKRIANRPLPPLNSVEPWF